MTAPERSFPVSGITAELQDYNFRLESAYQKPNERGHERLHYNGQWEGKKRLAIAGKISFILAESSQKRGKENWTFVWFVMRKNATSQIIVVDSILSIEVFPHFVILKGWQGSE